MMDRFTKEFVMELFLDSDSVSTLNRLTVAVANVVDENNENLRLFGDILQQELTSKDDHSSGSYNDQSMANQSTLFYEKAVASFSDKKYTERFGMKKKTVQALINFIKDILNPHSSTVPLDKKVHIFLWCMTSNSSFSEVASLFGMHKSSVSYIFNEISLVLSDHRSGFVSWPSMDKQHLSRVKINGRFKFPNCVGFIDTCFFKVGTKANQKESSEVVTLQAVCDESLIFIDVYISHSGSGKKSKIFRESKLSHDLKNLLHFENHILGDSEYKLKKKLITPFSCEEVLTSEEMKFNETHWRASSCIGHAFELLKGRFRRLNHIDFHKVETIDSLIYSACILHNFVLLHEGSSEIKEEMIMCDDGVTIDRKIVKNAIEKRQFLCNYINFIELEA